MLNIHQKLKHVKWQYRYNLTLSVIFITARCIVLEKSKDWFYFTWQPKWLL